MIMKVLAIKKQDNENTTNKMSRTTTRAKKTSPPQNHTKEIVKPHTKVTGGRNNTEDEIWHREQVRERSNEIPYSAPVGTPLCTPRCTACSCFPTP